MPGEIVTLAILALVPVVFVPGGAAAFEPHKVALLATGAAVLLGAAIARWLAGIEPGGFGGWWRSAASRVVPSLRSDPLASAILAFLLSAALSTITSPEPALSLFGVPDRPAGLITAIALTAIFFASRSARAPGWLDRIAIAASLAGAVATGYALLQLAGLDPVRWEWTATFAGRPRVPGTLGHPNNLGAYLAMTLPLTAHLARRARSGAARGTWIAIALAGLLALAATLSRGGWLGLVAAAATYAVLAAWSRRAGSLRDPSHSRGRGVRIGLLAAAGLAIVAVLVLVTPLGPSVLTRLRQIGDLRDSTTRSRLLIWDAGLRMAAGHPLLGVGTDAFGAAFPRYRPPALWDLEWNAAPVKAHNELVQITATQGAVGLLAALLVASLMVRALLRLSRHEDASVRAGAAVAGASLAAWAVSSLTSFSVAATGSLAAALAGWVAACARSSRREPRDPPAGDGASPPRALHWVAGGLLAALVWTLLVLTPWRAERAASRGLARAEQDPARALDLARACALAPWQERSAFELGRTLFVQASAARDPVAAWDRLERARQAFGHALRLAPENGEDRAFLARLLAAQSALRPDAATQEEASRALDEAIATDSTSAGVLMLAAQGYRQVGRPQAAHGAALRCARLYPDYAAPMAEIGSLAMEQGRFADAADTLSLALARRWRDYPAGEAVARAGLRYARDQLGADSPGPKVPTAPRSR